MNHQPFELWLVEDKDQLTSEELRLLQTHLDECADCRRMERAWSRAERKLASAGTISPPAGFLERWKSNLPDRIQQKQKHQLKNWAIGLSLAALVNLGMLTALTLSTGSITGWFIHLMRTFNIVLEFIEHAGVVINGLLAVTPRYIWILSGIITAGWVFVTSFAWLVTLLHINKKGVRNEIYN